MQRMKKYCINLPPQPWFSTTNTIQKLYDSKQHEKIAYGLYLQQQHNNEPMFNKPITLDVTFFMQSPKGRDKKPDGALHVCKPNINDLVEFLLHEARNVIIVSDGIISSITAKKLYSIEPRTEFIITEI